MPALDDLINEIEKYNDIGDNIDDAVVELIPGVQPTPKQLENAVKNRAQQQEAAKREKEKMEEAARREKERQEEEARRERERQEEEARRPPPPAESVPADFLWDYDLASEPNILRFRRPTALILADNLNELSTEVEDAFKERNILNSSLLWTYELVAEKEKYKDIGDDLDTAFVELILKE
ncbi:Tropomyosin-2 [Papilio machaon]|uniref:Tropomyosin-2 n=1 Tax=Papilio machaon TaxID=76193 RepID=A0A194RDY6_PAPMA|nr:Tropomyosin-2 [Papilio machaon]